MHDIVNELLRTLDGIARHVKDLWELEHNRGRPWSEEYVRTVLDELAEKAQRAAEEAREALVDVEE